MLCGICSPVWSCDVRASAHHVLQPRCCGSQTVVHYHGMSVATLVWLQSLLELAANEVSSESCKQDERLQKIYSNTLEHIRAQQGGEGEVAQRYEAINL